MFHEFTQNTGQGNWSVVWGITFITLSNSGLTLAVSKDFPNIFLMTGAILLSSFSRTV